MCFILFSMVWNKSAQKVPGIFCVFPKKCPEYFVYSEGYYNLPKK